MNNASTERLVGDLKTVTQDAEDLLKASAAEHGIEFVGPPLQ